MKNTTRALLLFCCLWLTPSSHATQIHYSITNLGANLWQYEYSITNDTLAISIDAFSVYFDYTEYANLSVALSPGDWDAIVLQPDLAIPDDGLYDAQALGFGLGIAPGQSLGGFQVQFEYLGVGTPGSQAFDIVDRFVFFTIDSGQTSLVVVPLPPAIWLFFSSLLFGGLFMRRRTTPASATVNGAAS